MHLRPKSPIFPLFSISNTGLSEPVAADKSQCGQRAACQYQLRDRFGGQGDIHAASSVAGAVRIASTGKNEQSGELVTREYKVPPPKPPVKKAMVAWLRCKV
ncbi:hypothetical protein [Yersinia aldovae]|uniref:hypothetical protein n=1 Tax=Yersinia aldovae TaxID=29483 RepID=UPI00066FBF3C|nr:hypothetical protein [Yersinia aldovae]